jgi:hypothetical protein
MSWRQTDHDCVNERLGLESSIETCIQISRQITSLHARLLELMCGEIRLFLLERQRVNFF